MIIRLWWALLQTYYKHGVAWKPFPGCSGVNNNGIGGGMRSPYKTLRSIIKPKTHTAFLINLWNTVWSVFEMEPTFYLRSSLSFCWVSASLYYEECTVFAWTHCPLSSICISNYQQGYCPVSLCVVHYRSCSNEMICYVLNVALYFNALIFIIYVLIIWLCFIKNPILFIV